MPEFSRLTGSSSGVQLDLVEREATPRELMRLSIQLHLPGLSLSNTVSVLESFGVKRARSTIHNWVQKADLQPTSGKQLDHVALEETVIQLDDQRYWLYAAIDPGTNEFLHVKLYSTRTTVLTEMYICNSERNTPSKTPCFSSIQHRGSKLHSIISVSNFDTKNMEIGTLSNVSSRR